MAKKNNNNLFETKTVGNINEKRYDFYVPDYQRGYRWTQEQVSRLLDDLYEWNNTEKKPYSLQPIIVHTNGNDNTDTLYHVVDGQQRLTTISLVLGAEAKFTLTYDTRPDTSEFLQELRNNGDPFENRSINELFGRKGELRKSDPSKHTIDNYHLLVAYRTIEEWKKNNGGKNSFKKVKETLCDAEILWYQITDKPRVVFSRINSGKIQLSDTDLIKATLLKEKTSQRSLISRNWDEIEKRLADDSFWAFIGQDLNRKYNRIELLFKTIIPINEKGSVGEHRLYNACVWYDFEGRQRRSLSDMWNEVWILFETLLEWYQANPMYHRIGYLSRWSSSNKKSDFNLSLAYKKYREPDSTKYDFVKWLDAQLSKELLYSFKDKNNALPSDADSLIKDVSYGDTNNSDIEKVLLLFNLPIEPGDWPPKKKYKTETDRYRYPFDLHIREKWSVEHIHAQSPKKPEKGEEIEKYLEGVRDMLEAAPDSSDILEDNRQKLLEFTKALMNKQRGKEINIENLKKETNTLYTNIEKAMRDRKDLLDNLTLLSGKLNTSIGNGFFFEKRENIIDMDRAGEFIPRETRNVFLKYYSKKLGDAFWNVEDREEYREAINEKLKQWFDGREEE